MIMNNNDFNSDRMQGFNSSAAVFEDELTMSY